MKIQLDNVSKIYPACSRELLSFLNLNDKKDVIVALQDLSFSVSEGEIVGIIGKNGAGKSTLLRLIAGIAKHSSGTIYRQGKVRALLDLTAGLNLLQTGRQNIHNILRMYGLSSKDITRLEEDIIYFSELENVINNPVLSYSSGMRIRLAFAICTAHNADILLLDEVLAVGDEFFASKSFRRLQNYVRKGGCCFIASHDWTKIFRISSRVLWLEQGKIIRDNTSGNVLFEFLDHLNCFKSTEEVKIKNIKLLNDKGEEVRFLNSGESLSLEFTYLKSEHIKEFAVIVGCMNIKTGESIFSAWSPDFNIVIGGGSTSGIVKITYDRIPLSPGSYNFTIFCVDPAQGPFPLTYYHISWMLTQEKPVNLTIIGNVSENNALFLLQNHVDITSTLIEV